MLLQLRWLMLRVLCSVRMLWVPWWQHRCTSHRCNAHARVQQALAVSHCERKLDRKNRVRRVSGHIAADLGHCAVFCILPYAQWSCGAALVLLCPCAPLRQTPDRPQPTGTRTQRPPARPGSAYQAIHSPLYSPTPFPLFSPPFPARGRCAVLCPRFCLLPRFRGVFRHLFGRVRGSKRGAEGRAHKTERGGRAQRTVRLRLCCRGGPRGRSGLSAALWRFEFGGLIPALCCAMELWSQHSCTGNHASSVRTRRWRRRRSAPGVSGSIIVAARAAIPAAHALPTSPDLTACNCRSCGSCR